jgi:hypothetical protein
VLLVRVCSEVGFLRSYFSLVPPYPSSLPATMQALRRDASVSSTDSSLSSASSINTSLSSENSRPRRRPSPPQLQALQAMFKLKSHPTRQDRVALAAEIGMFVLSPRLMPSRSLRRPQSGNSIPSRHGSKTSDLLRRGRRSCGRIPSRKRSIVYHRLLHRDRQSHWIRSQRYPSAQPFRPANLLQRYPGHL